MHQWLLETLADLQVYAVENGLPLTAAQLAEVARIAAGEIASGPQGDGGARPPDQGRRRH